MSVSGWDNFWQNQRNSFHDVMRIGTTFFAMETERRFAIKPKTKIFDYGCGPGFLADYFSSKGIRLTGADINLKFLEECRKNHPDQLFLPITTEVDTNIQILKRQLNDTQFDLVFLLSIIQYFKNVNEVERTIEMLLPYVSKGGQVVLADVVDHHTSSIRDARSLLYQCVRKNKIRAFLKFILYVTSSDYRALSSKVKLLQVNEESIRLIAKNLDLSCKKINGLTIHASRTNYVLTKK